MLICWCLGLGGLFGRINLLDQLEIAIGVRSKSIANWLNVSAGENYIQQKLILLFAQQLSGSLNLYAVRILGMETKGQ